ncbi:MAG: hypothetical protein EZS28_022570, partial [Streblomastix strix]
MKQVLIRLELEAVLIRSRWSMCWRMRLSIGPASPLCSLSRIEVVVQMLMMRIDLELIGCFKQFLFDLDKMFEGDSLLIYTICQEHLLL